MSQLNFDSTNVEPSRANDPIPAAWYNATISASETKIARSGNGEYLKLEFTVLDGAHAGRKVFTNLNLWNSNQQAAEIARRDLSAICHSVGVLQVQDSAELHNKPLQIKVTIRAADGSYDAQNEVKGYKPATSSGAPTPPAQGAMASAATPPPTQSAAPWNRPAA